MPKLLKLPIGIDNFEEIRKENFFYIDKTMLIEQLHEFSGKVNLFTRPRRFGKSLNMSMLRCFFDISADKSLFDGLYISSNRAICEKYMGNHPVICLSLKDVDGLSFEDARYQLVELIATEAERFYFLEESSSLNENDKSRYQRLITLHNGQYVMDPSQLTSSIWILTQLLYKHYGKKVVVLIDEYDSPLNKSFHHGYYKEMLILIRDLFGKTLKANEYLQFSFLTGCLGASVESIFSGFDDLKVFSIANEQFNTQFGFTEEEVKLLLTFYGLESHLEETQRWYDGYHFGDAAIYCPWDVLNHTDSLCTDPHSYPQPYWVNTSGNALVERFIGEADKATKAEIERLIAGRSIRKSVRLDLTYDEINSSNNIWSLLFASGYLTLDGKSDKIIGSLKIPNNEILELYKYQIHESFKRILLQEPGKLKPFWNAFSSGDAAGVETYLNQTLDNAICVFDTNGFGNKNFYQSFLFEMLVSNARWGIHSKRKPNVEIADLTVELDDPDSGIIICLKTVDKMVDLNIACNKAMAQVHDHRYDEYLRSEGIDNILVYGIAFYKKNCKVVVERL